MLCFRFSPRVVLPGAPSFPVVVTFLVLYAGGLPVHAQQNAGSSPPTLEGRVSMLFAGHCTECHSGPDPQRGMGLSPDRFYSNTVGRRNSERPSLQLIQPGNADSSYLIMKLRGGPGIVGRRMPLAHPPLSDDQIATVARWIDSMNGIDRERIAREPSSGRGVARPFGGWKLGDLPTTRMLKEGDFLFLISHHFVPPVSSGIDAFFGVDGGANILLSFGYAPLDNLMFTLARSNVNDDIEFQGRYRLAGETDDGLPVAIAAIAMLDWPTELEGATVGSHLHFSAQVPISREITDELGAEIVPGILLNPAVDRDGESPLITIGVGGQWHFYRFFSLFAEVTPIVAGYVPTTTVGYTNRFDSWSAGLDIALGGHDFQVFVANTIGTAANQYMSGGDLDIRHGGLRLGFNIYRILDF